MSESVKLKISPAVAACVRPGIPAGVKLAGIGQIADLEPLDQVTLAFCLAKDTDADVRGAAQAAFQNLPEEILAAASVSEDLHPAMLDAIAKIHHGYPEIVELLLANSMLSEQARSYLETFLILAPVSPPPDAQNDPPIENVDMDELGHESQPVEEVEATIDEESEEYLSKYKMAQIMGIGEKIKMALSGDKEWRTLLVKDANKLVSGSVIKNPRITDGEIVRILKSGTQNDDIMRLICANKEWIKNYQIRKALVENPRTPIQNATRYLSTLGEKELAGYAKSKNVSSVISTMAKRLLLSKKR